MRVDVPARALGAVLALGALATSGACGLFPSLDPLGACANGACPEQAAGGASAASSGAGATAASGASGGASSSGGNGGAGGTAMCAPPGAFGDPGVLVTPVGGQPPFCIDAHETSYGEIAELVGALQPSVAALEAALGAECEWAWPDDDTPFSQALSHNPGGALDDYPARFVHWCEARAACLLAGKDLCGDLDGGPSDVEENQGRWYAACSHNGAHAFSFEELAPGAICHNQSASDCAEGDALLAVTSPDCPGGFEGLYNMSGNAWEWTRYCETHPGGGVDDDCRVRGGTCADANAEVRCDRAQLFNRANRSDDTTFRCCWEAQ